MGLHKSKNRRREYDDNGTMHKMMNYLYILGNDNQDYMAKKVLELVHYIQDYLNAVQIFHRIYLDRIDCAWQFSASLNSLDIFYIP